MTESNRRTVKKQSRGKIASPTTVRCLVSGFDAFASFDFNPSQWVAERLPSQITFADMREHLEITKLVLPTCCEQSWQMIEEELERREYHILLAMGLANDRPRITMERFALNIRDYFGNADNSGHCYRDELVELGGPDALRTTVPLVPLEDHMKEQGFLVGVSNYAGSFVCDELYYRALSYQKSHAYLNSVLFVHLPTPENFAKTLMIAGAAKPCELLQPVEPLSLAAEVDPREKALDNMFNSVVEIVTYLGRQAVSLA